MLPLRGIMSYSLPLSFEFIGLIAVSYGDTSTLRTWQILEFSRIKISKQQIDAIVEE